MKRLALVAIVAAALGVPGTASAGGMGAWALSGPDKGIRAGDAWVAQLRVVACRGTPMNMAPTVAITSASGRILTFQGRKAGAAGKYVARVVFPSAGEWSYSVSLDGYTQEQRGPFVVRPARQQPRLLAAIPPVGAVLLVLGTGLVLRRRRT